MRGRVLQVSVKPETPGERGMPKLPVESANVTRAGVEGDFNRHRQEKKAGDPDDAILLLAEEVLRDLRAEGWPVAAGDLGENFTTSDVPYEAFQPGTRWRVGSVEIEIARKCDPCKHVHGLSYVGSSRGPDFVRALVGRRGWYARVLREGRVAPGDAVERI